MDRTSASRLPRLVTELCHSMAHDLFGGYRPELHYMRGPGPKCREKRRAEAAAEALAREPVSVSPDHALVRLGRA